MPVKRAKNTDKAKCDTLFSLIIRSYGSCQKCGYICTCPDFPKHHNRECKLTCSHIIGRKYSATRTLEDNAQSLCYSCHARFTDWPREFSHWITETVGSETYDMLYSESQKITKMDWSVEHDRLRAIAKEKGIK